jgi:D-inositol-3-phosphate glycosyltransferase
MIIRKRRPRVALITTHADVTIGGTQRWTKFLYEAQKRTGCYEVEIICLASSSRDSASKRILAPTTWLRQPAIQSSHFIDLPCHQAGASAVELEFQRYRPRPALTRLLRTFDVLQFIVGYASWACVAEDSSRPVIIWTGTTAWPDRMSRVRQSRLLRRLWLTAMSVPAAYFERRALRRADLVFVPSDYTRKAVETWARPGRTRIAFAGVDTEMFAPDVSSRRDGILSVGRFTDARKNLPLLLRAYAEVVRSLPEAPILRIVGEVSSDAAVTAAELGVDGRVQFLGRVSDGNLARWYRTSQLYVLPSDEEGLSNVIQEAMASGLPVVSTRCGGPPTIVRDGVTGLLTPVGNVSALASAIRRLLLDTETSSAMSQAARRFAEEHFALDASAEVFFGAWNVCVESDSARPLQ